MNDECLMTPQYLLEFEAIKLYNSHVCMKQVIEKIYVLVFLKQKNVYTFQFFRDFFHYLFEKKKYLKVGWFFFHGFCFVLGIFVLIFYNIKLQ